MLARVMVKLVESSSVEGISGCRMKPSASIRGLKTMVENVGTWFEGSVSIEPVGLKFVVTVFACPNLF